MLHVSEIINIYIGFKTLILKAEKPEQISRFNALNFVENWYTYD